MAQRVVSQCGRCLRRAGVAGVGVACVILISRWAASRLARRSAKQQHEQQQSSPAAALDAPAQEDDTPMEKGPPATSPDAISKCEEDLPESTTNTSSASSSGISTAIIVSGNSSPAGFLSRTSSLDSTVSGATSSTTSSTSSSITNTSTSSSSSNTSGGSLGSVFKPAGSSSRSHLVVGMLKSSNSGSACRWYVFFDASKRSTSSSSSCSGVDDDEELWALPAGSLGAGMRLSACTSLTSGSKGWCIDFGRAAFDPSHAQAGGSAKGGV